MMPKKIILVDNYDSFTFNLVHYLEQLECVVTVVKNDAVEIETIENYDAIVLSPGPGLPKDAGKLMQVIATYYAKKPILGVCLGMQAIASFFRGNLYNQREVKHGVSEFVRISANCRLYTGIEKQFKAGLYHSWAVALEENSPLIPTGFSENKVLMSVEHINLPIVGIQYHPESIMTENGLEILKNFLKYYS